MVLVFLILLVPLLNPYCTLYSTDHTEIVETMIQAIRNVLDNMHIFFLSKSPQQRLISLYRAEAFLAQVSMNTGRSGHGSARGNMQTLLRKPESTTMPPQ